MTTCGGGSFLRRRWDDRGRGLRHRFVQRNGEASSTATVPRHRIQAVLSDHHQQQADGGDEAVAE